MIDLISSAAASCERMEDTLETLAKSGIRLRAILDATGDLYLLVDHARRILDLNNVALNLLGRGYADCIGRDLRSVIADPGCRAVVEQVLARRARVEGETGSSRRVGARVKLWGLPDEQGAVLIARELPEPQSLPSHLAAQAAADQLLAAREDERRRLARELHDSVQQDLAAIQIGLRALGRNGSGGSGIISVHELRELLDRTQAKIRTCAYLLHPPELKHGDLVAALRSLTAGFQRRTGLKVRFSAPDQARISGAQAGALYRIAQEALTNVHRHARARRVVVRLHDGSNRMVLDVEDDGVGFDVEEVQRASAGVGIRSMSERAAACRGHVSIERLARGTLLRAVLPVAAAET